MIEPSQCIAAMIPNLGKLCPTGPLGSYYSISRLPTVRLAHLVPCTYRHPPQVHGRAAFYTEHHLASHTALWIVAIHGHVAIGL